MASVFHTARLYQKDIERKQLLGQERTRIAKDVHDDIGASLTRLFMLSEMAKNNLDDQVKTREWLDQISITCRNVTQGMTQIIWALDPKNETFEGVIAYIRQYAFKFLEPTSITCHFDVPEDMPNIKLDIEERRNIYLVFRETLNNIVKHSEASKVWIALRKDDDELFISIKDNGRGFDQENLAKPGNGLVNIKKRMKDIGGQIEIATEPGQGTKTTLTMPMETT
jgi:signal transduction histidine kinase